MENVEDYRLKTGTTTVGIVCKDGVVLGSDMRATMGHMIGHKRTQKVFQIDEHLGLTMAGLVGDAQVLTRYLTAEAQLFRLKNGAGMTVKGASTLLGNILSARRYFPYWVQLLLGGVDKEGPALYSLDAAGGCIPDNAISTGSGSPFVYGLLEDQYKEGMDTKKGKKLVEKCLVAAMARDSASGNGMRIVSITKGNFDLETKTFD